MPNSMRRESARNEQRDKRDAVEGNRRALAVSMLRSLKDPNLSRISLATGVTRRTVGRIANAVRLNDASSFDKLLNPSQYRRGVCTILSFDEEKMICDRIKYAGRRGFGIYVNESASLMSSIANDGRPSYHKGYPSEATVRSFRARHRDITLRSGQAKTIAKLLAENPSQARTLRTVLERIKEEYPKIMLQGDAVWNMDETRIGSSGVKRKIFMSSSGNATGSRANCSGVGGRHVTCIVTTSASGLKIPPFVIVEGAKIMGKWFSPLPGPMPALEKFEEFQQFYSDGWCPGDIGIAVSESGSVTKEILTRYIERFNRHVRKIVPQDQHVLLLLDGHKSRQGIEWVEKGMKLNVVMVQSPANTSHYLQAADQDINLILQKSGKEAFDILCSIIVSADAIQFKLIRIVYGYTKISEDVIRQSWDKTGLWPMDFRFVQIAESMWNGRDRLESDVADTEIDYDPPTGRTSDEFTVTKMKSILDDSGLSASRKIQRISILLKDTDTVNSILMNTGPSPRSKEVTIGSGTEGTSRRNPGIKQPGGPGTPAKYLTAGDYIKAIREKEEKKKKEEAEKHQRKVLREENKKRRLQEAEVKKKEIAVCKRLRAEKLAAEQADKQAHQD